MLGKVLNERYKIIKELGKGGMALVYEARDLLLDRKVALKILRPEYVSDKEFIRKFRHEAKAVARISHPNVVSIFDIARDGKYHYLVMENIEGRNLKDVIKERGKLSATESLDIAGQICSALIVAHENDIIHCDIKPHNILIDADKQVKVTDFGIARAVTSSTITATDTIMGSAHYFSPEQAKGGDIKTYSDIYSVGVVLYEMLTGKVPFGGDSPISVALKHIQEKPEKPSSINPEITGEIDNIIMKALAKEPENRFKNAALMKKEIISALKNLRRAKRDKKEEARDKSDNNNEDTKIMKKSDITGRKKEYRELKERKKVTADKGRKLKWWQWTGIIILILFIAVSLMMYVYKSYTDVPVVEVPDLVGMEIDSAREEASQVGLEVRTQNEGVYHSEIEEGKIISQFPKGGERIKQTREITVTVSKGPRIIEAPDLTGKTLREAQIILSNQNIEPGAIEYEYSNEVSSDIIISQQPAPETEIEAEGQIDLVVSKGPAPEMVEVPNIVGFDREAAVRKLEESKLRPGDIEEKLTQRFKEGQVAAQQQKEGTEVPAGSRIDFTVSKGLINRNNSRVHTSTVGIEVLGFRDQEIRIVVIDDNGRDVVYERTHKPGDYVSQTINSVGSTTFRVYIDGELVKEESL